MALEYTSLDISLLSAAAQKAMAPGQAKVLAAKGLAPLSSAAEMAMVLYQLSIDTDSAVAKQAIATVGGLPDAMTCGALADARLDARVVDFLYAQGSKSKELVDGIIQHGQTASETLCKIARSATESQVDLMATNEARLLLYPQIIGAMYGNAKARMSTIDRCVELAIRNDVAVPGIAAWEELKQAVLGPEQKRQQPDVAQQKKDVDETSFFAQADELFARIADVAMDADETKTREKVAEGGVAISDMTVPMKIRLAMVGNSFIRSQLIRDSLKMVAMAVIKAPRVTEAEVAKYAASNSLHDDVIKYIAKQREWTRNYTIRSALVQNPKTPIAISIRFLMHLRERDLRGISKSKNVPSAVSTAARQLLEKRTKGRKG